MFIFPVIPFVGVALTTLGATVLAWYSTLSPDEQRAADERANELAFQLYRKAIDELTVEQLERINDIMRRDHH